MPAGRSTPPSVVGSGGDAPPGDLARFEAQRLLDRGGGQRRIGTQRIPLVATGEQAAQRVAQQRGDGVVAGEGDPVHDRLDLAVADARAVGRVGIGVVRVEEFGAEVVGALVAPPGDEGPAVPPVVEHPLGDRELRLGGRLPPREGPAVHAPRLDQRVVGRWEADEPEHDLGGERERQRLDVLRRRTVVDHPVEQCGGALAHVVLERAQPAVREALAGVHADAGVVGFGPVRHDGDRVEVVGLEDGCRVG